jgi:hypothetical protein
VSLRRKPHTVTVKLSERVIADNVLLGHSEASQGTVKGQLTPSEPGTTYEQFGVDTKRPHLFFFDVADASVFEVGGEVTYGGREFSIVTAPRVFEDFGAADNASVVLEEQD